MKMKKLIGGLVMCLCLISLVNVVSGKWVTEGWDFDVQTVNFPKNVTKGDTLPLNVSIYNSGGKIGTVCIVMGIKKPDRNRIYPLNTKIYDIPVNQAKTATLHWQVTEPPGEYFIDVDIYEPKACTEGAANPHMFDTTGFVYPLEIKESCETISCPDKCIGNTRHYNGAFENGECKYQTQTCPYKCENGYCVENTPKPITPPQFNSKAMDCSRNNPGALVVQITNIINNPDIEGQIILTIPDNIEVYNTVGSYSGKAVYTVTYNVPAGEGKYIEIQFDSNIAGEYRIPATLYWHWKGDDEMHQMGIDKTMTICPVKECGGEYCLNDEECIENECREKNEGDKNGDGKGWPDPLFIIAIALIIVIAVILLKSKRGYRGIILPSTILKNMEIRAEGVFRPHQKDVEVVYALSGTGRRMNRIRQFASKRVISTANSGKVDVNVENMIEHIKKEIGYMPKLLVIMHTHPEGVPYPGPHDKFFFRSTAQKIKQDCQKTEVFYGIHAISGGSVRKRTDYKKINENTIKWSSVTHDHEVAFYDRESKPMEVNIDR